MPANIIALDFDGVICDSAGECLFSSYITYAQATGRELPQDLDSVPADFREGFYRLRPFIRDGKDYLLILYFLDNGIGIEGQVDFDAKTDEWLPELCRLLGTENGKEIEDHFQNNRRVIRGRDEDAWFRMNPLYAGVLEGFRTCRDRYDAIYVATNKPTDAAYKILSYYGVELPLAQVFGVDRAEKTEGKNGHLQVLSRATGLPLSGIHFVDDQVSHLAPAKELGAQVYLATWGYVTAAQSEKAASLGATLLTEQNLPQWMREVAQRDG